MIESFMGASDAPNKSEREPDKVRPAQEIDSKRSAQNLTAEEQMALFEKSLKEDDWGHQPC